MMEPVMAGANTFHVDTMQLLVRRLALEPLLAASCDDQGLEERVIAAAEAVCGAKGSEA